MKELSIEEKAKRYDEAIERAKSKIKNDKDHVLYENDIIEMFPELKETEDERIRKEIIDIIDSYDVYHLKAAGLPSRIPEYIAYLEKQGEHAKFCDSIQVGDKVTRNQDGVLVNLSQLKRVAKKQGEQKPIGKVEQKFKVGDYIISNNNSEIIYHITGTGINELGNLDYVCELVGREKEYNGRIYNMRQDKVDANFRLWTIQDARDGDVLVASDGSIFLFKGVVEGLCKHYIALTTYNIIKFNEGLEHYWENTSAVYPATKEQRDQLEKAMADAGYTFDFEKKELKKVEQTSADETPYPETLEKAIDLYYNSYGNGEGEFEHLSLEKFRDIVLTFVSDYGQKPAWSEEDKKIGKELTDFCIKCSQGSTVVNSQNDFTRWADWLKSLRPQNTWKPSDEHYELEEFAKIVRSNLTGISKAVQELFEAKYLQLTGNKMYGGFKD